MNIECKSISKIYNKKLVLNSIDLSLIENKIYCLIGKNGEGKTTLLKILSGYIPEYKGNIYLDNNLISKGEMSSDIHYVESQVKHFNTSIKKIFQLSSKVYADWDFEFVEKMTNSFKLDINKKYNDLSLGMKAMVNVIIGLGANTKIVIFDEAIAHCDSIIRNRFYDFIVEAYERRPRTIIVSTHLIDEISQIIEDVIILNEGKIMLHSSVDEIKEKAYTVVGQIEAVEDTVRKLNVINKKVHAKYTVATVFDEKLYSVKDNITVESISLQKFFAQLVGGDF